MSLISKSARVLANHNMVRHRKPPSQTWRTFLKNHAKDLVSLDFFVVPTITFQLLFAFVILSHDRRRPIHFAVTSHPTAPRGMVPRECLQKLTGCPSAATSGIKVNRELRH